MIPEVALVLLRVVTENDDSLVKQRRKWRKPGLSQSGSRWERGAGCWRTKEWPASSKTHRDHQCQRIALLALSTRLEIPLRALRAKETLVSRNLPLESPAEMKEFDWRGEHFMRRGWGETSFCESKQAKRVVSVLSRHSLVSKTFESLIVLLHYNHFPLSIAIEAKKKNV